MLKSLFNNNKKRWWRKKLNFVLEKFWFWNGMKIGMTRKIIINKNLKYERKKQDGKKINDWEIKKQTENIVFGLEWNI